MEGLLLRLSALDADAEAAVRVIAYFDALVERRATPEELVRSTANLAECTAGWSRGAGQTLRTGPGGAPATGDPRPSGSVSLGSGDARVWLERDGGPGPLDDLVLERLAIAARLLATLRRRTVAPDLADPALVELVLAEGEAQEDRARALHLLGLDARWPVRVLAMRSASNSTPEAVAVEVVSASGQRSVRATVIGDAAAVLLQPPPGALPPLPGLREALAEGRGAGAVFALGGSAAPLEARRSWLQARLALRFAVADGPDAVVDHDALGSLALLAEIPAERLAAQPDVVALGELAATAAGALDVEALEAFCRTGSLRQAAAVLHLHHSSVAARLGHVERALGVDLDGPDGRFRARLALVTRRLAQAPGSTPRPRRSTA
ncbi:MAG: helix-turn-helix domain-containing protein [Pseudonocardia sp.]|nr:helix-turn-helix domain-containing protein [Pseudonocardia sp.]